MIEQLIEYDKELLRFLNSFHTATLDTVMMTLTETTSWLPLYIFMAYIVIKDFKHDSWFVLVGLVLTIVLADQITSSLMKPYFARFRPSHEPTLEGLIHIVDGYRGGRFGFASSHAANTFGVASFYVLLFRNVRKWIGLLFIWATLVSYTRIYLGVHYPGDILVGAIVGAGCGYAGFWFMQLIKSWYEKRQASTG